MQIKALLDRMFQGIPALRRKQFLAAAAVVSVAGIASAGSIGVNFVNTGDSGIQNGPADALGSGEVAGAPGYSQANWNNLGRWGNPTPLNDHSGAGTSVNVTWDSANTWSTGAGSATPNAKLMDGYLDATGQPNNEGPPYSGWDNANKPDAFFTGLSGWLSAQGALSYSVVLYTDGDATEGRISEYWLQNASGSDFGSLTLGADATSHVFIKDTSNFSGTFNQVSSAANSTGNAGEGNYIVFSGLTSDAFLLRTEERDFRAQINGIQIIAVVPEPSSIALFGLGLGGLVFVRRRRS